MVDSTSRVRVRLAGQLDLIVDGHRAATTALTRHATLALAYLVLERDRRVARCELVETLWEERLPASWKTGLRGTVHRVRPVLSGAGLPATTLVSGAGWYELRLPSGTSTDVEGAAARLERAAALLGQGAVAQARAAAQRAYEVVRLPFLAGVQAAWVDSRQSSLDELRLRSLDVVASASLHSGDWAGARTAAQRSLAYAPLRESAHRLLALAHAGSGDRAEALRVLADCRQVLAEEIGAPVSPETQALWVGLLRGTSLPELLAGVAPTRGGLLRHDRSGWVIRRRGLRHRVARSG